MALAPELLEGISRTSFPGGFRLDGVPASLLKPLLVVELEAGGTPTVVWAPDKSTACTSLWDTLLRKQLPQQNNDFVPCIDKARASTADSRGFNRDGARHSFPPSGPRALPPHPGAGGRCGAPNHLALPQNRASGGWAGASACTARAAGMDAAAATAWAAC